MEIYYTYKVQKTNFSLVMKKRVNYGVECFNFFDRQRGITSNSVLGSPCRLITEYIQLEN